MQRAYLGRDESYDGVFFLAVSTTGIFCRPSCPARKPKPKNVAYYTTAKDALFAGYRPCKRCRPLETDGQPPNWVGQLMARVEAAPQERIRDADLRGMSIDPARARRYFHKHYGMTFQAFTRAARMREALTQIREGGDLTNVAFGHGYESTSGFREAFGQTFGRTPGKSRGTDCIVMQTLESPVGPLIACATDKAVCLLEFSDRRALETQVVTLRRRFGCAIVPGANEPIERLREELAAYFAGSLRHFTVPIDAPGTDFQQAVWAKLREIPYGETTSYEALATALGKPTAQRAVGRANGENRLAIVIPCHRVVNKNGKLGGYGGGLWRKQFLLGLERNGKTRATQAT